jgi:hypothetical protein
MLVLSAALLGACGGLYGDDELARYAQRSDKITLSAGDAKNVNAVTHTIDPWPPGVHDPRIPANGERMVQGIERYRRGPPQPPGGASVGAVGAAAAAGAAAGAGAAGRFVPGPEGGALEPGKAPPALQ